MGVDVISEDSRWNTAGLEPLAERAAAATLAYLELDPELWDISLLGCDDARIASLNAEFRTKPVPTNVLSWPSEDRAAASPGAQPAAPRPGMDAELGDIAISYDTCAREAQEAQKPFGDHVTHLVVHAMLHLLGYDHETGQDAALMEGIEVAILATLGISDPYHS